ncbi:hybrid sensor histidine kinase/response regulator [Cytophagales bacterium WSM2-2]|nr:hybrid sensor histidine kinase/response regulator [Cytophagales bacterium WSM2-2]
MGNRLTILVIEDKDENIFSLERLLGKPDRLFLKATNGKEGLNLAFKNNIDLVILDVQMPEMDGFEVAQILKSNKSTKDVPIIFASAEKKERDSIMKEFEEGTVDYLSKPLDPELTRAKVSVFLKIQLQKKELIEKNALLEDAQAQNSALNVELNKNVEELEILNKELESFSYSVSHDLRVPLRSVVGYSKILEEDFAGDMDDRCRKTLGVIKQNALKMNELIESLLEFLRLGKRELVKSEINTEDLLTRVVSEMKMSLQHKADVRLNCLPDIYADTIMITQAWVNLISNAIKYSSKAEDPRVEIGADHLNNEVVFYVKDNGVGFDMEYSDKLFRVFQRLHKQEEFQGTGIGLSLVRRIINRHGGRIWADAKVGRGATFYFSLPVGVK